MVRGSKYIFEIFSKSSWNEVVLISSINLQKSSKSSSYQKSFIFCHFSKIQHPEKVLQKNDEEDGAILGKGMILEKGKNKLFYGRSLLEKLSAVLEF